MKMTSKYMAIAVVVIFAAGIGGAKLQGYWVTKSTKQPASIKTGEFAGLPSPSDIRGSYTWADVAKAFQIDVGQIMTAFGAKSETDKVNTLEAIYGEAGLPEGVEIGTDSVRMFVSLLTGLPHPTAEAGTILPASAVAVLREHGKADPALIEEAAAKAWNGAKAEPVMSAAPSASPAPATPASTAQAQPASKPAASPAPAPAAPEKSAAPSVATPAPATAAAPASPAATGGPAPTGTGSAPKADASTTTEHAPVAGSVTGKTTFGNLKEWGLSEAQIKSATGGKIGPDSAVLRDWATANGVTFSELKATLQGLLTK